jgi:hypothetical protein
MLQHPLCVKSNSSRWLVSSADIIGPSALAGIFSKEKRAWDIPTSQSNSMLETWTQADLSVLIGISMSAFDRALTEIR